MGQKLGQHFLTNSAAAAAIVDALEIGAEDTIVEIGPGRGALTEVIAVKTPKKIIGIEKDATLAGQLREEISGQIEIIEGDALEDLPAIIKNLGGGSYKLIGNIPYYITGHLLRTIGELEHKPEMTVLMVQKEVAARLTAAPPDMNRLAASVQFWAAARTLFLVPRTDFEPAPEVDSAVILLQPRGAADTRGRGAGAAGEDTPRVDSDRFYAAVRAIFAQPRKTLFNNIKDGTEMSAAEVRTLMEECGVGEKARPQDLSLEKIEKLAQKMDVQ